MTKQDKIKRWLDDNFTESKKHFPAIRVVYKTVEGDCLYNKNLSGERLLDTVGIVDADRCVFIKCPDFEDDIEAPVALPQQERGKRFEPEKFVPDDIRNVLLRFQSLAFTGFLSCNLGWRVFAYDGAILELKRTPRASETFTWEEL